MLRCNEVLFSEVIAWVNSHEIFWLLDLKKHFGYTCKDDRGPKFTSINNAIRRLYKNGVIANCKTEKSERQYFRIREATIQDVYKTKI